MSRRLPVLLILLGLGSSSLLCDEQPLQLGARASADYLLESEADEAATDNFLPALTGLIFYRDLFGDSVFVRARGSVQVSFPDAGSTEDAESLAVILGSRGQTRTVELDLGLSSSGTGLRGETPFLAPRWALLYAAKGTGLLPRFAYRGWAAFESEGDEDLFAQALEAGVRVEPSIRFGAGLTAGATWVTWPELPLFSETGNETSGQRNDLVLDLFLAADGLLGYFTGWEASAGFSWRLSNANRWIGVLDHNSEEALETSCSLAVSSSPRVDLGLRAAAGLYAAWYPERPALDETGVAVDEDLSVLSVSAEAGIDWTIRDTTYLYATTGASRTFSNEVAERAWTARFTTGVEVLF
jgi:hypothetical protein